MTSTVSVLAITLFAVLPGVSRQAPVRAPLERAVIEAVNPLYPGFVEILDQDDLSGLARLARILSDHPSPESLDVLLWMLRHCPSWPVDGEHPAVKVLQLHGTIRAVGKMPLPPVVDALRHGSADHRLIAASLLGSHQSLVAEGEKPLLDAALIAALADPSGRVREMAAAGLRERGSAEAVAALRDYLAARGDSADVDRQVRAAERFGNMFADRNRTIPAAERGRIVAELIGMLDVPHDRLRTLAVQALGKARAKEAVQPIISLLEGPDGTHYLMDAISALAAIGAREALPTLARLARTAPSQYGRDQAVHAYIAIAKAGDPAAQVRRLLWKQPETVLEKRVLVEGKGALPAVWTTLGTGTPDERRTAAALLGWFRDTRSIPAIVTALDAKPGALTREQLLFDLNMILLTEAPAVARADRNALATLHLQWLYDQLVNQPVDSDIRSIVLAQKTLAINPDRLTPPLSVTLMTREAAHKPGERQREVSTTAVLSSSPQAFLNSVRKTGWGVAFHAITAASGVARVATTLYLPNGRIANQVWISLYRRDRDRWVPIPVPSHPVLHRMINEPSLMPTINRDYGSDHPLKILRLDLTMERVRVDPAARDYLRSENRDNPVGHGDLDASYVNLLERYKHAEASSVKYTAEFESARLTRTPNLPLWIDALSMSGTPFQEMAQRVLAEFVAPKFKAEGVQAAGVERAELGAAALKPDAVDPRLLPVSSPGADNIKNIKRWSRFGLVDVGFGSGPRGGSGYSMLFERRGNRWVFLCLVSSWMS